MTENRSMFLDVLGELNDGRTIDELEVALREVVADVKTTGKPGAIILTIQIEPTKKRDDVLILGDRIQVKKPEFDRKAAIFFTDDDGALVRHDPRQRQMFDGEK